MSTVNDDARPIDVLLDRYAGDHQDPTNQKIHAICVPVILWTTFAMVWAFPAPVPGLWAGVLSVAALLFYAKLAPVLAGAMLVVFAAMSAVTFALYGALGPSGLALLAGAVFLLAWVAQFVGHAVEGKRPSFFTDLTYLLIGPLWVVAKGLKRLNVSW